MQTMMVASGACEKFHESHIKFGICSLGLPGFTV